MVLRLSALSCFNPHPPFLADEMWFFAAKVAKRVCFNPHPPFLADEIKLLALIDPQDLVSIHIRHFWRMKSFACKFFSRMRKTSCFRELVAHVTAVFVP